MLVKNINFRQKYKFSSKIKIFVKNWNFHEDQEIFLFFSILNFFLLFPFLKKNSQKKGK